MQLPFQLPFASFLHRGSRRLSNALESRNSQPNSKRSGSVVIFGQYKSGTTALFCQLRHALYGHAVTELFESQEYTETAGDADRWLLAKVILSYNSKIRYDSFFNFQKKLVIYRDPRDWLISGMLFAFQQPSFKIYNDAERFEPLFDLLKKKESDPRSVSVCQILKGISPLKWKAKTFTEHTQWQIEFEKRLGDFHLVRYEDFIDGKLADLEEYLELRLPKDFSVDGYPHVARTKGYGNWRDWFLEEDVEFFRPIMEPYLEHYGYPLEWNLNSDPVIEPRFCSEYVTRTVAIRRSNANSK